MVRVPVLTLETRVYAHEKQWPQPRPLLFIFRGDGQPEQETRTFNETSTALKIRWARKGSGRMAAEETKIELFNQDSTRPQ